MLHSWAVDTVSGMGASAGLGAVGFGRMIVRDSKGKLWNRAENDIRAGEQSELPPSETAVTWRAEGSMSAPIGTADTSLASARSHIVTLQVADDALLDAARECIRDFRLRQAAAGNSWRRRMATTRAAIRLGAMVSLARVELLAACYPSNKKPVGEQCVSTGTKRKLPFGSIRWNGKTGWRQPVGRPSLPEAEWLKRYKERRGKARKGKARPRSKPLALAPKTKVPRPGSIRKLKCESSGLRDVLLGNVNQEAAEEFFEVAELEPTEIAGEWV